MSYLGRLGARAGGTASVGLAPAGRLASPFARIDQRLNLFVQWGTPLGRGTLLASAADQGAETGAVEATAPAAAVPTATRAADASLPLPQRAAPARRDDAKPPAFATPAPPVPHVTGETLSSEGALPTARETSHSTEQPSAPTQQAAKRPTARARKSERAPNEPRREPAKASVEMKRPEREVQAPVSLPENGSDPDAARALQQALDRVNAWMSKGSREEPASSREKPEPVSVRALPEATPERRVPTVVAPPQNPAAASPARERRVSLPTRAAEEVLAPRLTIGSIEVRVVPPTPPPVVVQAPRERARVAAAAPQSSARLPAHLTFGLRQR